MYEKAIVLLLLCIRKHYNSREYFFVFTRSVSDVEPKYYADGEDAYAMKRDLKLMWDKVCLY